MAKVNLPSVVSGYNLQKINDNDQTLATELNENVLYRRSPKGEPNEMHNNLDMNSNRIYNLPAPGLDHEPVRLKDINDLIADHDGQGEAKFINFDPYKTIESTNVQGAIYELKDELDALEDSLQVKTAYTPQDFGAIGDGVADDTVAVNAALAAASADGLYGVVLVGDSVYLCSGTITVPDDVTVEGNGVASLKRADSYVGNDFIGMGNRSSMNKVVVDGNRANNADDNNGVLVRMGDSSDVVIDRCDIYGSSGYGVVSNTGLRNTVTNSRIADFYMHAIAVYAGPPNRECFHNFSDNLIEDIGWGAFIIGNCDHFRIKNNNIRGYLIGQRNARLTVNTSGTTVTRVSGPDFAGVRPGNFVVVNSGMEFRILEVIDVNTLRVETALPALTGAQASVGPGDLIGIIASNFGYIEENTTTGCATFGMGFSLGGNSTQCSNNTMSGNKIGIAGKNAINVSYDGGPGFLDNNSIVGNKIYNAGFAGGIGDFDRIAIVVFDGTGGKVTNTFIDQNTIISFPGEGQTTYWLGFSIVINDGTVRLGTNIPIGTAFQTILNDVKSVDLSGWGTTASVSNISSYGNSVQFTVTSAGTGQTADPSFNVIKVTDGASVPSHITGNIVTASGGNNITHVWGTQISNPGSWTGRYQGTPVDGGTITVVLKS